MIAVKDALTVSHRKVGDIVVVDMAGKLIVGTNISFGKYVKQASEDENCNQILLNMSELRYIDGSGMGELVSLFTWFSRRDGNVKVCCLTQKVNDLLTITKMLTVFDCFDSELDGLAKFFTKSGY